MAPKAPPSPVVEILSRPKRPLSAYNLFFAEERVKLLQSLPVRAEGVPRKSHGKMPFREMAVTIGALWKATKPEDRKKYEEQAKEEKIQYKKRLAEWKLLIKNSKKKHKQYERMSSSEVSSPVLNDATSPPRPKSSSPSVHETSSEEDPGSPLPPPLPAEVAATPSAFVSMENEFDGHVLHTHTGHQFQSGQVALPQVAPPATTLREDLSATFPQQQHFALAAAPSAPPYNPQDHHSLSSLMRDANRHHRNMGYLPQPPQLSQAPLPQEPPQRALPQDSSVSRHQNLEGMEQLARRLDEQQSLDLFLDLFHQQDNQRNTGPG